MYEEKKTSRIEMIVVVSYAAWLVLALFIVTQPATVIHVQDSRARFIVSSWDYPDEYGNGIWGMKPYENSTGSWVALGSGYYTYDETTIWEVESGLAIKLYVYAWFNSTQAGATTYAGGNLLQRMNATVVSGGETVFSQANLTYVSAAAGGEDGADPSSDEMWLYTYSVVLNILTEEGCYYATTISYEIYW